MTQMNIKKDECKNLQALVEQQKKKKNISINIQTKVIDTDIKNK